MRKLAILSPPNRLTLGITQMGRSGIADSGAPRNQLLQVVS
jgi:hypothetical protein